MITAEQKLYLAARVAGDTVATAATVAGVSRSLAGRWERQVWMRAAQEEQQRVEVAVVNEVVRKGVVGDGSWVTTRERLVSKFQQQVEAAVDKLPELLDAAMSESDPDVRKAAMSTYVNLGTSARRMLGMDERDKQEAQQASPGTQALTPQQIAALSPDSVLLLYERIKTETTTT